MYPHEFTTPDTYAVASANAYMTALTHVFQQIAKLTTDSDSRWINAIDILDAINDTCDDVLKVGAAKKLQLENSINLHNNN